MSLKDQLKEDMKAAMKAREEGKTALSVIRMVNSAIKNTEINGVAMVSEIMCAENIADKVSDTIKALDQVL